MSTLADRVGGKDRVIGGPFGSNLTQRDYVSNGVPVIRGTNMEHHGRWIGGDFVFVTTEKAGRSLSSNVALPGDIVVTQRGTLGQVSIVPKSLNHTKYIVSQSQMAISVDEREADPHFVYYYLRSPVFNEYVANTTIQAGVPHINLGILRNAPVDWPDRATQAQIARTLGCLDDKIELNRRMNETLEAMTQAIFRDWFVDFGPTRRKQEGETGPIEIMGGLVTDAERAQQLADFFPGNFGDNGLPGGWEAGRLDDVLELAYGKSLTKGDRRDGPYPVYGSGGIGGFHDAALVKGPSVIVGRKGTVGSLYWEDRDFYPIDTVFYVKTEKPMTYCYYLLQTLGLDGMNTDAAVPGLNRNNAYRLDVAMASATIVGEFGRIAGLLRQRITSNDIESRTLAATRDLILPKLMSGEIRLQDAEMLSQAAE